MHDLRYWLALRQVFGLDWAWLQRDFLPKYPLAALWQQPEDFQLPPPLCARLRTVDWAIIERELDWTAGEGQYRLTLTSPHYPALLRQISDPPPVLYVEGQLTALNTPQIAMVGTRHPSHAGLQTTKQWASDLAAMGLSITSGLAYGIDGAAHQGALQADGITLAVMGTGIHRRYPKEHKALAARILEKGALISELSPDAAPHAGHFPARNRIITGLSFGVVVIEAALKSGSLISARLANEQGRIVMAVPGSIHSPQTHGCHWLLKQGACLVSSVAEVIDELPDYLVPSPKKTSKKGAPDLAKTHSNMVQYLGLEPKSIDYLVQASGLSVATVQTELTLLVLSGHAEQIAGGYIIAATT